MIIIIGVGRHLRRGLPGDLRVPRGGPRKGDDSLDEYILSNSYDNDNIDINININNNIV